MRSRKSSVLFAMLALVLGLAANAQQQIIYCIDALSAPTQGTPIFASTGGSLAAGTYYYVVTALNQNGQTTPSNELSVTATGSTGEVTISWTAVHGATGYEIWRGTTAGAENAYFSVGPVTSFLDTGGAGTAGTLPGSNTATGTACSSSQLIGNGSQGDYLGEALGKGNANDAQLYAMWGVTGILYGNGAPPNAPTVATGPQIVAGLGAAVIPQANGGTGNTTGSAASLTTLGGLPAQAANTVVCNATGSSASPTACSALAALGVLSSTAPVSETTSYAPTGRTNAFGEYDMNCTAACTFTLNSGLFNTNDTLTIAQTGTGLASIALGAGVTLTGPGNLGYATLGGQGGYIQIQDTGSDAWRVISYQPADTKFTITGGTCATAASTTGGNMGGTITSAATGTVASCTYIITPGGSITAKTEWVGTMGDQTQQGVPIWVQSAQGTSTITFTTPGATTASDVLSFAIHPE